MPASTPTITAQAATPHGRDVLLSSLPHPTPEDVAAFRALYLHKFGVELDLKEALVQSTRLLHIVALVMTPRPAPQSLPKP